MHRLSVTVFFLVSPTLAGVSSVAALVAGVTSLVGLVSAAALGVCVAIPVSLLIAKALS